MIVTFIRHAQCISNVEQIWQGPSDTLTDLGHKQAQKTADSLRDKKFDFFYSSDFVRCRDSLSYVRTYFPTVMHGESTLLREISRGEFAGKIKTVEDKEFVHQRDLQYDHNHSFIESRKKVAERMKKFFMALYTQHDNNSNICICGHSGAFQWFLNNIFNIDPDEARNHYKTDNSSVTILDMGTSLDEISIIDFNNTTHLLTIDLL